MALSHFRGHDIDDIFNEMIPWTFGSLTAPQQRNVLTRQLRGIPTDFVEKEKSYEVRADMPGVNKDDIKLDIEGDVLSFGVEKTEEKTEGSEQEGMKWHRVERSSQFQKRAMRLPEDADMEKVSAKYENGVLNVSIPKMEVPPQQAAKRITVG